jgi:hypothetical protein
MTHALPIAKSGEIELVLLSQLANRHGLITGATGTGKTVTLQRIAEHCRGRRAGLPGRRQGRPVGLGAAGVASEKLQKARLDKLGMPTGSRAPTR